MEAAKKSLSDSTPSLESPKKILNILSLKDEELEKLSKHIEGEKIKVANFFDSLAQEITGLIQDKKKQHLDILDQQVPNLAFNFACFANDLKKQYPNDAEVSRIFKLYNEKQEADSHSSQLQMAEFLQLGQELERSFRPFYIPEDWKAIELKKEIAGKIEKHFDHASNLYSSIVKFNDPARFDSKITTMDEFRILRQWLPKDAEFYPALLYRSSRDGKDPKIFHKLCDGKRNTVSLVKALFKDANEPCVIGGYLDEGWHSKDAWIPSKNAFLFSLTAKIKSPVVDTMKTAYGHRGNGPIFGWGDRFQISLRDDSHLHINEFFGRSFSVASALINLKDVKAKCYSFKEIEVEVFSLDCPLSRSQIKEL